MPENNLQRWLEIMDETFEFHPDGRHEFKEPFHSIEYQMEVGGIRIIRGRVIKEDLGLFKGKKIGSSYECGAE